MDEDPYSDSEYGSDDESIDSDMEGMSGMLGEDSDEEEGDDEERFEEVKEVKKVAAAWVLSFFSFDQFVLFDWLFLSWSFIATLRNELLKKLPPPL